MFVIVDGAYFAYDAPPGQYFLQSCTATKPILKTMEFRLVLLTSDDKFNDQQIHDTGVITVKPREMVYVGAQKVSVKTQPGLFRRGETNIGPMDSPSEKEVLQKLLPALAGMPWESVVKDRIAKLNEEPPKAHPPNPSPAQPLTALPLPRGTSGAQL